MPSLFALIALSLGLLLATLSPTATAQDAEGGDWVVAAKARSPSDISLWTRTIPGAELKAFRGATQVTVPLESTLAFLYDTQAVSEWMFRCKEARVLEERPDGSLLIYMTFKGIWPVEDRDAVVRVVPAFNTATGEVLLTGTAAPDYLPPVEGYIRIPAIESSWLLRPAPEGRLYVQWTGQVDPGGAIPLWLANVVATLIPRHTLKEMRNELAQAEWQQPGKQAQGAALLEHIKRIR